MAAIGLSIDRRRFLSTGTLTAIGTAALPHPIDKRRAAWDRAMAQYEAAKAHADQAVCTTGEIELLDMQADKAFAQLIQMPAPDRQALHWKLKYFARPDSLDDDGAFGHTAEFTKATIQDMCRLLGDA